MKRKDVVLTVIIRDIETSNVPTIQRREMHEDFEMRPYSILVENLSGWIGALLVRSILYELGSSEVRLFKWRLENKYIQYLIFNYYCPDTLPMTFSLSKVLNKRNGVTLIKELFMRGYFIKSTLGDGSGKTNSFDKSALLNEIINSGHNKHYKDEEWILQKKLNIKSEFRVHSFKDEVIAGLTFVIGGSNTNFSNAEDFVRKNLVSLPKNLTEGTLLAWDIALTANDRYYIIEANFTGFHPVHRRGFQTTGYVDDPLGAIVCALLNQYFKEKYWLSISDVDDNLLSKFPFLREFLYYATIFTKQLYAIIKNKGAKSSIQAVVYLENENNAPLIRLMVYFLKINFAKKYTLIIDDDAFPKAKYLFEEEAPIDYLPKSSLFTNNQYHLVKQLSYERMKAICSFHAVRLLKGESYIIV